MKKLFLISGIVFTALFVFSCNSNGYDPDMAVIINNSAYDVSYVFGNGAGGTIDKGDTVTFERPMYVFLKSYDPAKRVSLNEKYEAGNHRIYTFSDMQNYEVQVINGTDQKVTLSADDWMDPIDIEVAGGVQSDSSWLIYTDKPVFTATAANGFPVEVVYNFEEGIFKLTIRWGS